MKIYQLSFVVIVVAAIGCSTAKSYQQTTKVVEAVNGPIAGDVEAYWSEPMYDSVIVPGQLDPKANYYRLPHRTLYEIRPGRVQPVQYPAGDSLDDAERR